MPDGGSWVGVQTVSSLVQMTGRGMRSEDDWCECVPPDALILTDDLRWVPAASLALGDGLLAFDELAGTREKKRQWKRAVVEANDIRMMSRYRIELDNGEILHATPNHMWVSQSGQARDCHWIRTDQLRVGNKLNRYMKPWGELTSKDAGWLAGFYDGEGCMSVRSGKRNPRVTQISASQKPGATLNKALRLLDTFRFPHAESPLRASGTIAVAHRGGVSEHMRFLGQIRPERLLSKMMEGGYGQRFLSIDTPRVVAVERVGPGKMVAY